MKPGFINQPGEMIVAAQFFVWAARMPFADQLPRLSRRQRFSTRGSHARFLSRRCDSLCGGQKLCLGQVRLANDELTGKDSTFFDVNRFRGDVPFQHTGLVGIYWAGGNILADNLPLISMLATRTRLKH